MYIRMLSSNCPLFGGSTVCTYVCCPQSVLYSEVPLYVHTYVVPKVSFIQRFHCMYIHTVESGCVRQINRDSKTNSTYQNLSIERVGTNPLTYPELPVKQVGLKWTAL